MGLQSASIKLPAKESQRQKAVPESFYESSSELGCFSHFQELHIAITRSQYDSTELIGGLLGEYPYDLQQLLKVRMFGLSHGGGRLISNISALSQTGANLSECFLVPSNPNEPVGSWGRGHGTSRSEQIYLTRVYVEQAESDGLEVAKREPG